ncbi:MAG TPA: hypothetical protein VJ888_01030 [Mobilitalea sp.]|nr:hypothetical protein [Mobilitalea sp.]HKL78997.1 hypothetical protein [Mobilitalea sp.]
MISYIQSSMVLEDLSSMVLEDLSSMVSGDFILPTLISYTYLSIIALIYLLPPIYYISA